MSVSDINSSYLHTYILTYIHTYIRTYLQYIHTYIKVNYKFGVSKKLLLRVSGLLPLQRVFKMEFDYSKSFLYNVQCSHVWNFDASDR